MLIRKSSWDRIQSQFTADERSMLMGAKNGDCIWPEGFIIDVFRLTGELREKVIGLVGSVRSVGAGA